ncbi:hypothetical protein JOD17_002093 [Geomicrobium sediminis]|uniref:Uncharacterized protein n=1 Tax=Geomicrobium sediminis TaxID=1347788 RepID=A0ABS2PCF4_9BACL|nr:hypothetical protein [Geomicrobium sediminis]
MIYIVNRKFIQLLVYLSQIQMTSTFNRYTNVDHIDGGIIYVDVGVNRGFALSSFRK